MLKMVMLQLPKNEHLLHNPSITGSELFARKTSALMHNKFVVLSQIDDSNNRIPKAVLVGSTNWTENGCYRQANVFAYL